MTDIVERLRSPLSGINRAWVLEAANEIERLRTLPQALDLEEKIAKIIKDEYNEEWDEGRSTAAAHDIILLIQESKS